MTSFKRPDTHTHSPTLPYIHLSLFIYTYICSQIHSYLYRHWLNRQQTLTEKKIISYQILLCCSFSHLFVRLMANRLTVKWMRFNFKTNNLSLSREREREGEKKREFFFHVICGCVSRWQYSHYIFVSRFFFLLLFRWNF